MQKKCSESGGSLIFLTFSLIYITLLKSFAEPLKLGKYLLQRLNKIMAQCSPTIDKNDCKGVTIRSNATICLIEHIYEESRREVPYLMQIETLSRLGCDKV